MQNFENSFLPLNISNVLSVDSFDSYVICFCKNSLINTLDAVFLSNYSKSFIKHQLLLLYIPWMTILSNFAQMAYYNKVGAMARRFGQKYSRIRIHVENRTKVFENQNSWRESNRSIRESKFMARIGQKYSRIRIHVENRQKYSRIRFHVENRKKVFENQNSWREWNRSIRESKFMRESDKSIRESEFMARIEQKYSRIRIHGENRTKIFENQNSWRESEKSIRESEFMARIEQKYSRIKIHGENRTEVFEH